MPSLFGDPNMSASIQVALDVEKAIKIPVDEFGEKFRRWLYQAVARYFDGKNVDTRYATGDVCVYVRREGDDLIVEYARPKTIHALEKFAQAQELGCFVIHIFSGVWKR